MTLPTLPALAAAAPTPAAVFTHSVTPFSSAAAAGSGSPCVPVPIYVEHDAHR